MTNDEARFNKSLRPRKPEGSLEWTAQDVHLDSHTAPELWQNCGDLYTPINLSIPDIAHPKKGKWISSPSHFSSFFTVQLLFKCRFVA